MLYTERTKKLESLKKKYKFFGVIEDISEHINSAKSIFGTDESQKENLKELENKLKGFQNTIYGLNATNKPIMTKQEMDDVFEAVKRGEINFNASFTIYTNRTNIGKSIVKTGLSKEEAHIICDTCNGEIIVPQNKNILEMIGYMWCVEE